jgi:hypothetical protein
VEVAAPSAHCPAAGSGIEYGRATLC